MRLVVNGIQTARQLGLKPSEIETIGYLIEKHLWMSNLAQRRDIHDTEVIVQLSVDVRSLETLQMLYVRTCADLSAVGPGVLNEWKRELLTKLYLHARECLAGDNVGAVIDDQLARRRQEIHALVTKESDPSWWQKQIDGLQRSFLFGVPSEQIVSELGRLRSLPRDDAVAWARWLPDRNVIEYTIGAYEEITPGIFLS